MKTIKTTSISSRYPPVLSGFWLLPLVALFLFTVASLEAQANGETAAADNLPPKIQVVALSDLGEALWWQSPDGMQRISPSSQSLGPSFESEGGGFELFRRVPVEDSEEFRYLPVGDVRLLPQASDQLVVIFPYDRGRGVYPMQVFDHTLEAHPRNHVRFINLAPKPLGLQTMDDAPVIVKVGESLLRAYPDTGLERISMRLAVQTAEGWENLASRHFLVAPGVRFLFLGSPLNVPAGGGQNEQMFVLRRFVD